MAFTDTLINMLFDGRYRVVRKLGSGGMADVYLAEDEELGRRVAIKILNERHANDEQFVERFRREAKNAAGLSHPNIVSIYDRGEAEGTYYIAMEYLDGRSLKELVVARGPLPIGDAITATRPTTRSSSASGARRRMPQASRTRTSSPSTTAARPKAPTTSPWNTSPGAR